MIEGRRGPKSPLGASPRPAGERNIYFDRLSDADDFGTYMRLQHIGEKKNWCFAKESTYRLSSSVVFWGSRMADDRLPLGWFVPCTKFNDASITTLGLHDRVELCSPQWSGGYVFCGAWFFVWFSKEIGYTAFRYA